MDNKIEEEVGEVVKIASYKICLRSGKTIIISQKDYLRISNDLKTGIVHWIQVGSEVGPLINAANIEVIE
jgi:hypothetical protein